MSDKEGPPTREELADALEMLLRAYDMLFPCLKYGSVPDYALVCTTGPVNARQTLARFRRGSQVPEPQTDTSDVGGGQTGDRGKDHGTVREGR